MKVKFRYIFLTGLAICSLAFVILLRGSFFQYKNATDVSYYLEHPDVTYTVFSGCQTRVEKVDKCYAAYTAAVSMAESTDCSPSGIALKYRFKKLVGHSPDKEEYLNEEIALDCHLNNH